MKPNRSILHKSFRYVPAGAPSVAETWRRFGWRPTTHEERKARRAPTAEILVDEIRAIAPIRWLPGLQPVNLYRHGIATNVQ